MYLHKIGSICMYRKALYFWSLGISLYLEFCFLSFVLRNLFSGTSRTNHRISKAVAYKYVVCSL